MAQRVDLDHQGEWDAIPLTQLDQAIKKLDRFDVLVVDDLSYTSCDRNETDVLFALLANETLAGNPENLQTDNKDIPAISMGKISFPS